MARDSLKYIFNKSRHPVNVTDNYLNDTEGLSNVFLFHSLQLWPSPFSFGQISKQWKRCNVVLEKKSLMLIAN